ncbi:CUB and Sushi multiple domains furrowed isoform X2 [Brevipalpus obovatus]|uniref:CUB and Sushi multiple domains furrowed isoform X2 n=1 Tax=Brevipalpus obovatus TaxID=246614 RepID=UPI003D9E3DC9
MNISCPINCLLFLFLLLNSIVGLSASHRRFIPQYGKPCPHPAVPLYAQVTLSDELQPGSKATYKCDDGYELFGPSSRTCNFDGKWSEELPYCAVNVAYGKPSDQSSTIRGGESRNANDGNTQTVHENKYCTETKNENSPWWQVDLLQPYEIRVVRIITRGCCGHQPLHDLEIRVGNSSAVQGNRLCAWYPGTLDDGITKDLQCAHPIVGRYVYIQMVGVEASLSLCEVLVFTTKEFSEDRCGSQMDHQQLISFNQTCYEFQTQQGGSFMDAENYCKARGGLVVNSVGNVTHNFLHYELEKLKSKLKSRLVWLGARREVGNHPSTHRSRSSVWRWVNGALISTFLWAADQPNNYNGQQNCIVLDGGRKWQWNDVTCDLDYLPWICQYTPSNCGSPDKSENSTIVEHDFRVGREIHYRCPIGHMIMGNESRRCESNGFWSGSVPTCKYINCGPLGDIEHGRVILVNQSRTTFNATALYICDQDFTIVGNDSRHCLGNGSWSGVEPKCLYSWCPELLPIPNGILNVTNRTLNGLATYTCQRGHKLISNGTRQCQIGGKWTGEEPICKYIDCGVPLELRHGRFILLNSSTTYESVVKYECSINFTLIGNSTRTCTEYATWSGLDPMCKLIDCGQPEIPPETEVTGDQYTINSVVEYKCKPGHKQLSGDRKRKCGTDGKWDGIVPTCRYIDCGRVQTIFKGEVKYLEGQSYLGSQISYSCSPGYKLKGTSVRECADDGKWTDTTPKCEEIRCLPPEKPKNSSVVYSGNDRSTSDSFKVGSTVQYRCASGHIVSGESLRTCEADGKWSGVPPVCVYIECGFPHLLPNGRWLLSSNTTHYGSTVEYECSQNFKLEGPARRICLENGTWSNIQPSCEIVNCGRPPTKDEKTIVKGGSYYSVGETVQYSCQDGYELVGEEQRVCGNDGLWSNDTPFCRIVDCGKPPVLTNGKGYLRQGTTNYGSLVEYHCMPKFGIVGGSTRTCLSSGVWSGSLPRCIEQSILEAEDNDVSGRSDLGLSSSMNQPIYQQSKAVGIGISVAIGVILVLIITVTVVCLRTKKPQPVKNTENVEITRPPDKETATVMSYSRLSLESEAAAANNLPTTGLIRPLNGLSTFSVPTSQQSNGTHPPGTQPIYANTNGFRNGGATVSVAVRPAYSLTSNGATTRYVTSSANRGNVNNTPNTNHNHNHNPNNGSIGSNNVKSVNNVNNSNSATLDV